MKHEAWHHSRKSGYGTGQETLVCTAAFDVCLAVCVHPPSLYFQLLEFAFIDHVATCQICNVQFMCAVSIQSQSVHTPKTSISSVKFYSQTSQPDGMSRVNRNNIF